MHVPLEWPEIALRLIVTAIAGTVVGLNRGEHGRPAGLRTNILVCMAASITMIQVNLLLATAGKTPSSFVSLDMMRLPLGILTGMGFIGGGAILKRGDTVLGVTTAATLWFVTVVGLCIGGGQIALGIVALAIGMIVLSGLKQVELRLPRDLRATLVVTSSHDDGPDDPAICAELLDHGFATLSTAIDYDMAARRTTFHYQIRWRSNHRDTVNVLLKRFSDRPGVMELSWAPQVLDL